MPYRLRDEELELIRRSAIFSALHEESLNRLLSEAAVANHERGAVLFLQGETAKAFYVVLDGWVKVYRMTPGGEEAVVGIFTRGQSFAEAAAFTGGVYPASGETVTEVKVLRISAKRLFEQISASPEIGLAMLASTSQHLHQLVQQIEQLKAHTGAQRVAEFLVSMAPVESGACTIALPYDKALLAGKLGMKPESLSRAFQRLKPYGVVINREMAVVREVSELAGFMEQERSEVMKPRGEQRDDRQA